MPDIADGESVEMQGSGAKPYVLKNVGGVYSCSCPAWRNQSIGIERRTCKHLRKYRGEAAEEARIGGPLLAKPEKKAGAEDEGDGGKQEPPLLLAESWDNSMDLSGWWMSEKLDGVRAYWDGQQFLSRQGNLYHAPDWFSEGLPDVPLDGELWIDRKAFQRTVSIVRRQDKSDHWKTVRFVVFDAPAAATKFEDRIDFLKDGMSSWMNSFVTIHEHSLCRDVGHLREELRRIEALGGEGLMLRQPGSKYAAGRSATLLKVKTFYDAEAEVISHEPGKGRHQGRLGALTVQLPNGKRFSVGTGFSDKQREQPPAVGSLITFRYQELSDAGIPRFPSYVGLRSDVAPATVALVEKQKPPATPTAVSSRAPDATAPNPTAKVSASSSEPTLIASRYFEFVEGKSSKFWEIGTVGVELTTRWGRIGSKGQSKTKKFSSADEAWAERNAAIESKLAGGYMEIEVAPPADSTSIPKVDTERRSPVAAESDDDVDESDEGDIVESRPADHREPPAFEEELSRETSAGLPARIHLIRAADEVLTEAVNETNFLLEEAFIQIGDFSIRELPVVLRAFFRAPNLLAVICELGNLRWTEFSVRNADGTNDDWSNVPMHDGVTPPWSTIVVRPDADVSELHSMTIGRRTRKESAQVSPDDFQSLYEESYARSMEWRSNPHRAATHPPAPSVAPQIETMVWKFAREFQKSPNGFFQYGAPDVVPSGKAILQLQPAEQVEIVKACFVLRDAIVEETRYDTVSDLRERLLKKNLPFTNADIEFLANRIDRERIDISIFSAIERWAKLNPLSEQARTHLRNARDNCESDSTHDSELLKTRIDAIVGDSSIRNPIKRKEVWAVTAIDEVEQMPLPQRTACIHLFQHCVSATSGKPSAAWIGTAKSLIAAITRSELLRLANKWFSLVDKPWPEPRNYGYHRDPLFIGEGNQDILRGLVWCCSLEPDAGMARTIGALGISAYRKIRNIGARAVRVGNACVYGLGVMADADAVAQLAILKVKVKFGTAQRFIEAELNKAAERLNLPREELEEISVPAYGLDEVGLRRESLGDFTAEVRIGASGKTELRWLNADGTAQKSIPAAIQQEFANEIKELKDASKDIDKMLPIQCERIDGLFLQSKSWPLATWSERYLQHPLLGTITHRIIWQFRHGDSTLAGIFHEGQLVGCDDRPIAPGDDSIVELWHPLGRPVAEITAWRTWLERHEVQQPFKQAHREVYLLTDAELQTRIYSNRFAAHLLRQSQFRALASTRGWQAQLLGYWDGGDCARATRRLPQWNIQAEYWLQGLPLDANEEVADFHGSAGMPRISTDQVRFCRPDDPEEPIPLADVPPLVFSEIMRDVDLFVGVASVGNDPEWADAGPNRQYADYCQRIAFGDLSATARTRFEVLERLLPRLKIADRCELADRFLVVRGDLRTYKIHLGSGNILMSPNDQYLCIVPKPSSGESVGASVFLPFEGDRMLSIILSKAFLLADDRKIKDRSILAQIATT